MLAPARPLTVVCLIACMVLIPWSQAFAAGAGESAAGTTLIPSAALARALADGIAPARIVLGDLPVLEAQRRQTVAQTNRPNILIGIAAGVAIVAGVGLITYGASSTCKGKLGVNACGKRTLIGGMAVSGGSVTLVVWGLSRP